MKRQKRNHQKKISSQYQILLEPDWNQAENCLRFENCSRIRKVEQTHTVQINANPIKCHAQTQTTTPKTFFLHFLQVH